MDSFEFNKIAGAILGTGLLVLGLKNLGAEVYRTEVPEKAGFAISVAEAQTDAKPDAPVVMVPIGKLLASADKTKGETGAKTCAACHDFSKGGPNKVGPNLWDVVGRPMGSVAGYAYSDGMKAMGTKPWGYEELNTWLLAPSAFIKGTKMSFGGIKKDEDRANVIAYLASLSDSPKPFPAP